MIWFFMAVYVAALFQALWVWLKRDADLPLPNVKVTVVVPFRNEEENLCNLSDCLATQTYNLLEVIFVNDHSEDSSVQVLESTLQSFPFSYKLLSLGHKTGKKAAIARGVAESAGEIILTTDADCSPGDAWVDAMIRPFHDARVKLVSGPVSLTGDGVFRRWQKMEFATLIALGAVFIRKGKPTMGNGANLAYRKSAFEEVGGFGGIEETPSGDDELLMMKVSQAYPNAVVFRKSEAAMVSTPAIPCWSALRQQRLRWASKWKSGKRPATRAIALFVFALNLCWLLLPLFGFLHWVAPEMLIWVYGIRFAAEALWIICLKGFFHQVLSLRALVIHQFLYPSYVVYVGLMANFGNYRWKGRSYRIRVK